MRPILTFSNQNRDTASSTTNSDMATSSNLSTHQSTDLRAPPRTLRRQKARIGREAATKTVPSPPETSTSSSTTATSYQSRRTLASRFSDTSSEGSITSLDTHLQSLKLSGPFITDPNALTKSFASLTLQDRIEKEGSQDWFVVPRTGYWVHNGGTKPNPMFEEDGYDSDSSAYHHDVNFDANIETATYNHRPARHLLRNSGVSTWTDYPLSTSPRTAAWPGGPPGLTENPTMWPGAAVFPRRRAQNSVDWGGPETGGERSRRWVEEWEKMAVGAKERNYDANGERLGEDGLPLDLEKVRKAAQERYEWEMRGVKSPSAKR